MDIPEGAGKSFSCQWARESSVRKKGESCYAAAVLKTGQEEIQLVGPDAEQMLAH